MMPRTGGRAVLDEFRAAHQELLRRLPAIGVVKVTIRGQVFHDTEKGTRGRAARTLRSASPVALASIRGAPLP